MAKALGRDNAKWKEVSNMKKEKNLTPFAVSTPDILDITLFKRGCVLYSPLGTRVSTNVRMLPLNNRQPSDSFVCSQCNLKAPASQHRHAHSFLIQFAINSQSIDSNSVYRVVWESGPA
jgi:hypothetical protein